jgi:WD40 repeat protein
LSGSQDKSLKLWDISSGRELREFKGQSAPVSSVAFVGSTNQGLVGSHDSTLKLWDLAAGRLIRSFRGHSGWIDSVAVSPSGNTALSGSHDHSMRLWDLATGRQIREFLGHSDPLSAVSFVPNTSTALSGGRKSLKQWQLGSGRMVREFKHNWADEGGLRDWMKREGVGVGEGPEAGVEAIAVLPGGASALTNGSTGLQLWDLTTGRKLRQWNGSGSTAVISPEGKIALFSSLSWENRVGYFEPKHSLTLFDLIGGKEILDLKGHSRHISSVAMAADGKRALSGSWDGTLRLWELSSGRETQTLRGHLGSVEAVAIRGVGATAISGGADGTIRVWDLNKGKELAALLASVDGEQATFTPQGFFNSSRRDTDMRFRGYDYRAGPPVPFQPRPRPRGSGWRSWQRSARSCKSHQPRKGP